MDTSSSGADITLRPDAYDSVGRPATELHERSRLHFDRRIFPVGIVAVVVLSDACLKIEDNSSIQVRPVQEKRIWNYTRNTETKIDTVTITSARQPTQTPSLIEQQWSDPELTWIVQLRLAYTERPTNEETDKESELRKKLCNNLDSLEVHEDNLVYRKFVSMRSWKRTICIYRYREFRYVKSFVSVIHGQWMDVST